MNGIHSIGFIFSVVILGVLATGVIVSVSLNSNNDSNKKKKHTSSPSPSPSSSLSNYSFSNANDSSKNLNTKMSQMAYNPYLNSSNKSDWGYGSYRGGNEYVSGCGC